MTWSRRHWTWATGSAVLFGLAIAAVALAHFGLGLMRWSFWIAYILTRPLGASIGDYLSQPSGDGGLGLGTTGTSAVFLVQRLSGDWMTVGQKRQPAVALADG